MCIWHINKNVLAHCKKSFSTEAWEVFYGRWKSLIKADSEPNFEEMVGQFRITYNRTHADLVKYLNATYISFRQRFVKCWTDRVRHFETTTTSRGEGGHDAVLKRQLGTSNGDLKAVVDGVALLLTNELHNHLIAINSAKDRYPTDLRKPIFQRLASRVTPFALRKILGQYNLLVDQPTAIRACTEVFTTVTGLPCNHRIQERLYDDGVLLLEDVHPHWRLVLIKHC